MLNTTAEHVQVWSETEKFLHLDRLPFPLGWSSTIYWRLTERSATEERHNRQFDGATVTADCPPVVLDSMPIKTGIRQPFPLSGWRSSFSWSPLSPKHISDVCPDNSYLWGRLGLYSVDFLRVAEEERTFSWRFPIKSASGRHILTGTVSPLNNGTLGRSPLPSWIELMVFVPHHFSSSLQ
ncbi:hypothetical protein FRC15_003530 [Serendipita sp. 397]|nr:hypothetical protein FRC15_003530 [Serendipita sp. 397]